MIWFAFVLVWLGGFITGMSRAKEKMHRNHALMCDQFVKLYSDAPDSVQSLVDSHMAVHEIIKDMLARS